MSNDLVKQAQSGGLLALMDNLDTAADRLMTETGTTSGVYFQFSGKTGQYTLSGQPVDPGTVIAFNMLSLQKGRICWADGKPIARDVKPILGSEPLPQIPLKEDWERGHRWNTLVEVGVRTLDEGTEASFSLSAGGGVSAMTRLFREFATKARMYLDDKGQPMVPLVEIGADKKTGKDDEGMPTYYFVPTFKIVEWAPVAELAKSLSGAEQGIEEDEPQPEPEPKPAAKPAVKPGFRNGGTGRRV